MDTKEIYEKLCIVWSRDKFNCIEFATYMIKENDTPDECQYCPFQFGSGSFFCGVTDRDLDTNKPHCSVYDFTKWLLENI